MTITNKVSLKSVMSGNTPIADVVDAPTIGAATAGTESATVAYTAATTGGTATSFTAISTPGSVTGTGASPITVSGLTGGTAYTFKVYGTNASGVWSGVQSAASNSVTPAVATSFESIASASGTGASTITFSSIPATYKSLQVRMWLQTNATTGTAFLRANGISSSVYSYHLLNGNGATVTVSGLATQTSAILFNIQDNATSSGNVYIVDIQDYASTTNYKTIRSFGGIDLNGSGNVSIKSALYQQTTAISSLTFDASNTGGGFGGTATIALYGIKG